MMFAKSTTYFLHSSTVWTTHRSSSRGPMFWFSHLLLKPLLFPEQQLNINEAVALSFPWDFESKGLTNCRWGSLHLATAPLSHCLFLITSKLWKHDPINAGWELWWMCSSCEIHKLLIILSRCLKKALSNWRQEVLS